ESERLDEPAARRSIMTTAPIALTSGEPAGIGPDLCLMLAEHALDARIAVLADIDMLAARARRLGIGVELLRLGGIAEAPPHRRGSLAVLHVPAAAPVVPGTLDIANAGYVVDLLRREIGRASCRERVENSLAVGMQRHRHDTG